MGWRDIGLEFSRQSPNFLLVELQLFIKFFASLKKWVCPWNHEFNKIKGKSLELETLVLEWVHVHTNLELFDVVQDSNSNDGVLQ